MSFISKVFIKDGIASDTEIVINKHSGEVVAINDILATIPGTRGVATYQIVGVKSTFTFEGVGQNEMWVEYDGILAKSSSVNLSSKILSGVGIPNGTLGYVQDWYINSSNGDAYEKTGISTWTYKLNIKGPKGDSGGTYPSLGAVTTKNLYWKLDYKLDEYDSNSNGNHLFVDVEGFSGNDFTPFLMHGIYIQEDGEFNFLKTAMLVNTGEVLISASLLINNLNEVFLKVSSNEDGIRAVCKAYRENGLSTNKMIDAVIGFMPSEPINIVSTEALTISYLSS